MTSRARSGWLEKGGNTGSKTRARKERGREKGEMYFNRLGKPDGCEFPYIPRLDPIRWERWKHGDRGKGRVIRWRERYIVRFMTIYIADNRLFTTFLFRRSNTMRIRACNFRRELSYLAACAMACAGLIRAPRVEHENRSEKAESFLRKFLMRKNHAGFHRAKERREKLYKRLYFYD